MLLIFKYKLYKNIDSVIGITRTFLFKLSMVIFLLSLFCDTLTQDNHLKYPSILSQYVCVQTKYLIF
jgi:hypothetical protein